MFSCGHFPPVSYEWCMMHHFLLNSFLIHYVIYDYFFTLLLLFLAWLSVLPEWALGVQNSTMFACSRCHVCTTNILFNCVEEGIVTSIYLIQYHCKNLIIISSSSIHPSIHPSIHSVAVEGVRFLGPGLVTVFFFIIHHA